MEDGDLGQGVPGALLNLERAGDVQLALLEALAERAEVQGGGPRGRPVRGRGGGRLADGEVERGLGDLLASVPGCEN